MMNFERRRERLGVVALLLREVGGKMARANLMECLYILQSLKRVPLGYRFKLHVYGPYDDSVLDDLFLAREWGYIAMKSEKNGTGYRYIVSLTKDGEAFAEYGKVGRTHEYKEQIKEIAEFFKNNKNLESFEKYATLVFIVRALIEKGSQEFEQDDKIIEYFLNMKGDNFVDDAQARASEYLGHLKKAHWLDALKTEYGSRAAG